MNHTLTCEECGDVTWVCAHIPPNIIRISEERDDLRATLALAEAPFPLALFCPSCGQQHVDDGEWATRPHRRHACVRGVFGDGCGATWRPSDRATVGVVRSVELDDMGHTPARAACPKKEGE